jgi:nitrate reductase assembly molybdenum cofactor insertion protein NarJ
LQHCIRLFQGLERFNSELSDYLPIILHTFFMVAVNPQRAFQGRKAGLSKRTPTVNQRKCSGWPTWLP